MVTCFQKCLPLGSFDIQVLKDDLKWGCNDPFETILQTYLVRICARMLYAKSSPTISKVGGKKERKNVVVCVVVL